MSTLFTGLLSVVELTPGVGAALIWAVPLLATLFVARWGVSLVFGRRR